MRLLRNVIVLLSATLTIAAPVGAQTLVRDVRAAIGKNDMAGAEALVVKYRSDSGTTSEALAALSWLGRGALAAGDRTAADRFAKETERLTLDALKTKSLRSDSNLVTALGAALEVQARVMSDGGQRASAVRYLEGKIM